MLAKNSVLKLPKGLNDHPLAAGIEAWFREHQGPLRPGGLATVAAFSWSAKLERAITNVQTAEHLLQGMDLIKREMDKELNGIQSVAQKSGAKIPERLSRLLLLACDGSDRFYRQAETVLLTNKDRMAGCMISTDSEKLGALFSKKKQPLKALLINDRKTLENFLIQMFE